MSLLTHFAVNPKNKVEKQIEFPSVINDTANELIEENKGWYIFGVSLVVLRLLLP
jgi:hypothetical protein